MMEFLERLLFHGKLNRPARIILALAAVAFFVSIALPLWQMTMISNQFPEGLRVRIYPYKLEGDLQEINILNHYVGMAALDAEFFPELRLLPVIFAAGGVLSLLTAALGYRWVATQVFLGGGLASAVSTGILVYRLYSYGHNLDPMAPIDIPPFTPPPFGVNQLANFHVTTFFHVGTLVFALGLAGIGAALWVSRPRPAPAPATAAVTGGLGAERRS
jgi:copper chaperone NosL